MGGSYRPVYDDDELAFSRDTTSNWGVTLSATVTATNFHYINGSQSYSITVANGLSGLPGGKAGVLTVEVNNSKLVDRSGSGNLDWTVNPVVNQHPTMGQRHQPVLNPSFTANWCKIGVFDTSVASITSFNGIPARFIRLRGLGLTAAVGGTIGYLWTDGMSQGN